MALEFPISILFLKLFVYMSAKTLITWNIKIDG